MAEPLAAGDPVKDFALTSLDGSACDSISARKDGLLLFVFWKRTCGTCQYAFPYLQRFQVFYGGPGFRIWGIAQESEDDVRDFIRQYGATFTQLLDEDLTVTEQYDLDGVPALYLVDDSDRILRSVSGFSTEAFNEYAQIVADRTGKPYTPIVRPEDNAPPFKPG